MDQSSDLYNLRRTVLIAWSRLTTRDKRKLMILAMLQVLAGVLDLVGIIFLGALSSLALNGLSSRTYGDKLLTFLNLLRIEQLSFNFQITLLVVVALTSLFLRIFLSFFLSKQILAFLSTRASQISRNLFEFILSTGYEFVRNRSLLEVQFSINRGIDLLIVGCLGILMTLIADTVSLVLIFAGLLTIDTKFALFLFASLGLLSFILYVFLKSKTVKIAQEKTKYEISSNQKIQDTLLNFREIYVRNQQPLEINQFSNLRKQSARAIAETMFLPSIPKFLFEMAIIVIAVSMVIYQILTNDAFRAISILVIFMTAVTRIGPALLRIQQGFLSLKTNSGQIGSTMLLLNLFEKNKRNEITNADSMELSQSQVGEPDNLIVISNAYFQRGSTTPFSLSNINFSIKTGEFIVIVGRSGSGKSTLVDIILGILKLTEGAVTVKGYPPSVAIRKFPNMISYIPQEIHVLRGSIRDNIQVGVSDRILSDIEIWNVLKKVKLDKHVRSLSDGLDSAVGERGGFLSGGQKQRLGIARALISRPTILIMDESTSSLDPETEKDIMSILLHLKPKLTLIAVTHRFETIKLADRVVYVSNDGTTSVGTLHELSSRFKEFRNRSKT